MQTFVIYTTRTASYIVPKDKAKLPKQFTHSYEVDSPVEICNKRIRLSAKVTKPEHINGILQRLVYGLSGEEIEACKKDLGL